MPAFETRTLRCAIPTLVVFAAAAAATAADSVLLKPKPGAPAEAYLEFNAEAVQTMAGPTGKSMDVQTRSVFGLLAKTAATSDGMELSGTLDRLTGFFSFRSADASEPIKGSFDTDDPEAEDASPDHRAAFSAILNLPIRITLDAQGVGTAADGGETIRKRLLTLGDQNFVAKSLVDEAFTDRQIMSGFGETLLVLCPNREVKVGETWKKIQHDEYPQVGTVTLAYDCTLDRVEKSADGDVAIVSFKGTITKDPDEKPAEGKRLGNIDGSFAGTARFSVAQGRFVATTRETRATVEVPPFWTREPTAPLMKIEGKFKNEFTVGPVADRLKHKDEIAKRVADIRARREAEEAAAMAGPVDPVTPENAPVPWLQWGGPTRNFRSDATGLANRWPKDGPRRLWERPLGDGFSAVLCDGDALYTQFSIRDKDDPFKGDEVVVALDARTGKTLWEHQYAAPWPKDLQMEFGPGPHSTPVIVGDRIFTVGCTAQLLCLDKKSGKPVWSKDLLTEYKAALNERGYGASPLAYNGAIILPVSSQAGYAVMAFAQSDGAVVWKGGNFEPGYASLFAIDAHGTNQLVAFTGKALCGLDPTSGGVLWSVDHPTQFGANISTPVWDPGDQHLFISSAYGMGSRGVKLEKTGSQITAAEVWQNKALKIQFADAVRVGDWVYGSSGDFGPAFLACVNAKTGEFGWRQRGLSKANLVYADGKLIVLDEDGTLALVKADPTAYRVLAKASIGCQKPAWTVPTLHGRTLYVRDRAKIMALDLGEKQTP
jgi:outer membrane protein assembly factor BamB